jgi:hypothetical protein
MVGPPSSNLVRFTGIERIRLLSYFPQLSLPNRLFLSFSPDVKTATNRDPGVMTIASHYRRRVRMSGLLKFILAAVGVAMVSVGCGGGSLSVKEGDRFEVIDGLTHKSVIKNVQNLDESFNCVLPKGTVVTAVEKSDKFKTYFTVEVVAVGAVTDKDAIEGILVPNDIKSRADFQGFNFVFSKDLLGKSLKRLK